MTLDLGGVHDGQLAVAVVVDVIFDPIAEQLIVRGDVHEELRIVQLGDKPLDPGGV